MVTDQQHARPRRFLAHHFGVLLLLFLNGAFKEAVQQEDILGQTAVLREHHLLCAYIVPNKSQKAPTDPLQSDIAKSGSADKTARRRCCCGPAKTPKEQMDGQGEEHWPKGRRESAADDDRVKWWR